MLCRVARKSSLAVTLALLVPFAAHARPLAFVTVSDADGTLAIVDPETLKVEGSMTLCHEFCSVSGIAISPDGTRAYATSRDALFVVDTLDRRVVDTVPVAGAGIVLSGDGTRAFISGCRLQDGAGLCEVDLRRRLVQAVIPVDQDTARLAISSDGSSIYTASSIYPPPPDVAISVVDVRSGRQSGTIPVSGYVADVAVGPVRGEVYGLVSPDRLTVVDPATRLVRDIPLGAAPRHIAFSP